MGSHILRKAVTFLPLPEVPAPWKEAQAAAFALLIDFTSALWNAAGDLAECPPGGPSLPNEQSDVPGSELQPSADMVLLHLVRIMIKSADCDPGAKLLAEACSRLKLVRANQGKQPVQVGPITATSVGEALLAAGKYVTDALRGHFGGGKLVNAVLNSFPHDPDLDPWDFGLILNAWRILPNTQELVSARRRFAEILFPKRSEFVRLLLSWDVFTALDEVRTDPICRWLHQQFNGFPADRLRQELNLDFARAPFNIPPPPRILVDLDAYAITLDGSCFRHVDPDACRLVQALLDAKVSGENGALPIKCLRREYLPGCNHDKTFQRWRSKLPAPLQDCVRSKPGAGVWLQLPPLPSVS
jgi:hypothetical protein